jgi:hypothetical protein
MVKRKTNKQQKLSKLEQEIVEAAIKESLSVSTRKQQKEKIFDMNRIGNHISEYLDTFILLGYDLSGMPVRIVHTNNPKDVDSLSALTSNFITEQLNGD